MRVGLGISKPMLNQRMKDPDHDDRNGQMAMIHVVRVPTGPKKRKKKEMGHPRSQHFVLESRDIESVTRREGRWGFSKVYPWNGRIQP